MEAAILGSVLFQFWSLHECGGDQGLHWLVSRDQFPFLNVLLGEFQCDFGAKPEQLSQPGLSGGELCLEFESLALPGAGFHPGTGGISSDTLAIAAQKLEVRSTNSLALASVWVLISNSPWACITST